MSETTTTVDPGTWIRGITIRQPWTTCILAGKDVENRPAPWSWRGWLLLHAGQATERAPMRDPLVATAIRGRDLPTRAVIGVARLTACHQDAADTIGNPGYWNLRNDRSEAALVAAHRAGAGKWLFAERRLMVDWTETRPSTP
ncbi:hypothetical protein ACFXAQ_32480 [Streptomyces olivaceus]|uniref:hypothetical protein n=1 Tax=Streptomyces olivaceus TaxID=47716 RepID=UPI0036B67429